MKPGQLLQIVYAGKPVRPGPSGWTMKDDRGYPKDDGKLAINLYGEPWITTAGTFWFVYIGSDNLSKLVHEEYLNILS